MLSLLIKEKNIDLKSLKCLIFDIENTYNISIPITNGSTSAFFFIILFFLKLYRKLIWNVLEKSYIFSNMNIFFFLLFLWCSNIFKGKFSSTPFSPPTFFLPEIKGKKPLRENSHMVSCWYIIHSCKLCSPSVPGKEYI